MRLLHVVSALAGGGAEIFVKDLSISCRQTGHELAIAYISSAKDQNNDPLIETQFKTDLARAGVELYEIGHACRKNPLRGAFVLRQIVQRFKPDVLHIHLGQGLVYRALMLFTVSTLYTHHNIIFKFGRLLTAWFDLSLDGYVAICKSCEVLLRQRTSRPVTLIRNGISQRRTAAPDPARGQGAFRVLSVGRISEQKNYRSIIRIAMLCKQQFQLTTTDISFQICGDGADIDTLRAEAQAAAVDDIVHFLGARTDVPELMAASDVLLMTSIYEGMPITLIEATHAGLPLIATDVGGCPEIVAHEENGYLFKPNDDATAAGYLCQLRRDPQLRRRMSQKSVRIAEQFGMDHVVEQHLALYRSISGAA